MKSIWVLLGIAGLVLGGCDSKDEGTGGFELLAAHMAASGLDLDEVLDYDGDGTPDWLMSAPQVMDASDGLFIVDLRVGDKDGNGVVDFEDGHVPGAHAVELAGALDYVETHNTGGLPVVVICYTGQTAAWAAVALRLAGHDARVLKFGMSSWHPDFDSWSPNVGNGALEQPDGWSDEDTVPAPPTFGPPTLQPGAAGGEALLEARVSALLSGGWQSVSASDVLGAPGEYHVLNYWAAGDWAEYGHVVGAHLLPPGSVSLAGDGLAMVDPDRTNVIYCWTGMTAAAVAAWLTVLGYDARSMRFSANALVYDELQSSRWDPAAACQGYPYEVGP